MKMEDIPLEEHAQGRKMNRLSQNLDSKSPYRIDASGRVLVSIEKMPTYLTPSQRLQMRKQRFNERITQLHFKTANESSSDLFIDSDEDIIDACADIFNVPLSSQADWTTNTLRKPFISDPGLSSSSPSHSERSSSMLSYVSDDLTCASSIYDSRLSLVSDEKRPYFGTSLSNDALELSMRFGTDGKCRIMQEARERRRLLSLFLKIDHTNPQSAYNHPEKDTPQPEAKIGSNSLQYFLSTRPSWLPPKSLYDKIKHQKESEDIIYRALSKQSTTVNNKLEKLEILDKLKVADVEYWTLMIETDINALSGFEKGRKMYWRGIPNFKKAFVWSTLLRSETKILKDLCTSYFSKSFDLMNANSQNEKELLSNLFKSIDVDILNAFPEQELFQDSVATCDLKDAIVAFLIYSQDTTALTFENPDEFEKFLSRTYFLEIANLSCLLYSIYRDKFMVFRTLCVLFSEDKLLGTIMRWRQYKSRSSGENLAAIIKQNYLDDFSRRLEEICPNLSSHLKLRGISMFDFAPSALISIMSNFFSFDLSMQILNIWIFERDLFLITSLLAMMKMVAHKLFGSKEEIVTLLTGGQTRGTHNIKTFRDLVDNHDFIHLVNELMPK